MNIEQRVYDWLNEQKGWQRASRIRESLPLSPVSVSQALRRLRDREAVVSRGRGKAMEWICLHGLEIDDRRASRWHTKHGSCVDSDAPVRPEKG